MIEGEVTFRVFVSSPFEDFIEERNALQSDVFPHLEALCRRQGFRFQAIDLRWGIGPETAYDQRTVGVCLEEIQRCQKLSPRPNFVVLLGDRYGWRPLPAAIPAEEYTKMRARIAEDEARELLDRSYELDANAVPAEYFLKPRLGAMRDDSLWRTVEEKLRSILLRAAGDRAREYSASATEREIWQGVFAPPGSEAHVFAFLRHIDGNPDGRYVDLLATAGEPQQDTQARDRLTSLKDALRHHLGDHVFEYSAAWNGEEITKGHLATLCADMERSLAQVLQAQIKELQHRDSLKQEWAAHTALGEDRAAGFIGRETELAAIDAYLKQDNHRPMVVVGAPGAGKSALLARAVRAARSAYPQALVIERYVGSTPGCSDARGLMESVCREISRFFGYGDATVPVDLAALKQLFGPRLSAARAENPVLLFLDGVDQLPESGDRRGLNWIPRTLPSHVWLVMSASGVPAGLEALRSQACVVELPGIPKEEGRRLLESWLQREGRRLQPAQMSAALERIPEVAPASLYWLVWQEVRLWRSGHDDQTLPPKEAGILQILFRRLVDEHGRTLVKRSLGVLAAAGEGLAEDELLGVLSADEAVMKELHSRARHKIPPGRIPVAVWARLRSDLGAHIATRVMDQLVLLCFRDGRVRDAVAGEFALEQDLAGMHQRLADYFETQPLFYDSVPNLRKLRVQVRHQALAGRLERVGGTLTDLRFLEAKCCMLDVRRALMRRPSYRGIYALLADFRMALDMGERLGASETLRTRLAGLRSCLASQSANIAEWPQGLSWQVAWDARRRRMGLDGIAWLRPDSGERPALDPYLISDGSRLARRLAPSLFSTTYVAVLAESGLAATVGNEGRLVVIDTETGEEVFSVVVEPASTCAFVRAEQPFVVVGGISGALHLVDADRGEVSASLRPFRSEVIGLAASRQGRFVAGCGSKDRTVKVIELATEQEWKLDEDYYHSFNDCAFSPAEDLLAVASTTGAVYLHRAPGGDWVEVYKHKADADVCVFSPSGRYLASGGHRGDLILWDVEKAREVWRKEITAASIPALAFVGETRLFSGDADGFIEEHDVQSGCHVRRWTELPGTLFRMAVDTKRMRLLAAASGLWEIDLLQAPAEKAVELGAVYCVAALPDGTVAVGGAHPALSVLNPDETPDPAPKVLEADGLVSLVEVGPLPNQIVVGWSVADKVSSPAGRIEVRELGSGEVKVLAEGNADVACGCYVNDCCFPDSDLDLLVACFSLQRGGGCVDRLAGWKFPAGSQVHLPCHPGQGPSAVDWITDRNIAVAGHGDGTVRVYQSAGGDGLREIKRYRLHEDIIWGCVYAPAFGGLITAGRDGYLKISDSDAGKEIRALQRGGSPITWCALAPGGDLLATVSSSGAIRLWGPDRNEPLALFRAGSYLNSVKFSSDGEWLYFGGGRGLVGRLRLSTKL